MNNDSCHDAALLRLSKPGRHWETGNWRLFITGLSNIGPLRKPNGSWGDLMQKCIEWEHVQYSNLFIIYIYIYLFATLTVSYIDIDFNIYQALLQRMMVYILIYIYMYISYCMAFWFIPCCPKLLPDTWKPGVDHRLGGRSCQTEFFSQRLCPK